jgi:signal transduction histidine kinase
MVISIAFSMLIYVGSWREFDRMLRIQRLRNEGSPAQTQVQIITQDTPLGTNYFFTRAPDPSLIAESRHRVLLALIQIDGVIFVISAVAGYFLAGRTLRPIREMVDEQNRFITDASHELNTPLTSLRTAIEVNLRDKKLSLSKAKDVLLSNLEDVGSLQALTTDLMKLNQYQKPAPTLPHETLSLASVLQSAKEKVLPMAQKKQISVKVASPSVQVIGNDRSLTELFVILLDNAIKYSDDGKLVSVTAKRTDGKVRVAVTDQGVGIEKEALEHIFDRFYRADTSRTKQHVPGYGLGLSIAKRIVSLHKGSLSVTSILGRGTTFSVELPVKK